MKQTRLIQLSPFVQPRILHSSVAPEAWLGMEIEKQEEAAKKNPFIQKEENLRGYELKNMYDDQQYIAYCILDKVKRWLTCSNFNEFEPLRCTISGQSGTGKSILLNTIASTLRRFSNSNNTVFASALTERGAFNINGQTIHSVTGRGCKEDGAFTSRTKPHGLRELFSNTLVLMIDERNIISSQLLAEFERKISSVVFQGRAPATHSWGGIPVVILDCYFGNPGIVQSG